MRTPLSRLSVNSLGCGVSGHVTYAPEEPELAARLTLATPVGPAVRCLRCGAYVPGAARAAGPADHAPIVLRGRALQDAVILRLLAVERLAKGLGLALLAYVAWTFERHQGDVAATFYSYLPALRPLAEKLGLDLDSTGAVRLIRQALEAPKQVLLLVLAGLVAYSLLQLTEGLGLWLMKRWGEYIAVVATSAFIPIEVHEIIVKPTFFRVLLLVINIAAVVYLLWTKRLFGVRGGHRAYEAERNAVSLLEVEKAAAESAPASTGSTAVPRTATTA